MSASLNPFGFRPVYNPSGIIRPRAYKLVDATQAAYATALYKGAPVKLATDGSLAVAAAAGDWLGVLEGFEYTDSAGKPTKASHLPASPTGITNVTAFINDDPYTVYEVQSETAVANTAIGDQFTVFSATYTAGSGSTASGQSTCAITGALAGAGVQGMGTIVGIAGQLDNAYGDAFTVVQIQNSRHQFRGAKVAV